MEAIFCSENICFVKVSKDLLKEYLEMVNDIERVAQYIGNRRTPYSVEEELDFIKKKTEEEALCFSMLEKNSGEFIGNIELMDVKDGCSEMGIAITGKKQDMHYGTEAIRRLLAYGFEKLGLKRIVLKVYPYNKRAIRVYENCGFVPYDETDTDIYMEIYGENWKCGR